MTLHDESYRRVAKRQQALNEEARKVNEDDMRLTLENVSEMVKSVFPTDSQTVFANTVDITELDDMWLNDDCVREGIQEAAYCARVYELLRDIKNPRKDAEQAYTELGKLIYDDVDNYLFSVLESK